MTEFDIVCLGELLIDMFPGEIGKRLHEVRSFFPKPGGAPANVAVAASRLGAASAFLGKVGEDHFGTFLAATLEAESVNTTGLRFDSEARTTLAIIAQPSVESAEFVFYRNPGADQRLTVEDLETDIIQAGRIFHFGSLSLTVDPSRSATLEAIEIARKFGAVISCDVNYRPALWKDPSQAVSMVKSVLGDVDLLKVNETEATLLSGIEDLQPDELGNLEDAADVLLGYGPGLVVISLGSAGSFFKLQAYEGIHVSSYPVESIDSVGCGDAFMAGLLVQISREVIKGSYLAVDFLQEAVQFANAVGALTSRKRGAIPAMPRLVEVEEFLQGRDA